MKKKHLLTITLLVVLLAGCSRESRFAALKTYLEQTPQNRIDAGVLFKRLKPVYEPLDKGVPFLLRMTKSENPADVVAAYLALVELCAQIKMNPTPQGLSLTEEINPHELFQRFEKFDYTVLGENWKAWFIQTHENMKNTLEKTVSDTDA